MNYRTLLFLTACHLLCTCSDSYRGAPGQTAAATEPELQTAGLNILMINVEDLSTEAVGCYGNAVVQTPYIDGLARDGVLFSRAYAQGVMCGPSRASFLTGLRPLQTGVLDNPTPMNRVLPDYATSLAEELRQREGAYLATLGKLYHFVPPANEQMRAFDEVGFAVRPEGFTGTYRYEYDPQCPDRRFLYSPDPVIEDTLIAAHHRMEEVEKTIPHGGEGWWQQGGKQFYLTYFEMLGDSGSPEECMEDGQKARAGAEIIRQMAGQGRQFFLSIGFDRPHTPSIAPKKYVDLYDPAELQLPPARPEGDKDIPDVAKRFGNRPDIFKQVSIDQFPQFALTEQREREALAAYYGCASYVDAQVGILLDALEEAGVADNTAVVFFSDHGFHLGEHGMWSKYSLFDEVTRVPFIVKLPGNPAAGQTSEALIELVDLLPTLNDLWDVAPDTSFAGTSLLPLVYQPDREGREAAFVTSSLFQYLAESTVTKDYTYNRWTKDETVVEELYRRSTDPHQQHNLAGRPEHAATLDRLRALEPPAHRPSR